MTTIKEYIGDAVYAEHDSTDGTITLTTENGVETTNEIFLESEVYNRLLGFVARVRRTLDISGYEAYEARKRGAAR